MNRSGASKRAEARGSAFPRNLNEPFLFKLLGSFREA